jgi:hypothetical protein
MCHLSSDKQRTLIIQLKRWPSPGIPLTRASDVWKDGYIIKYRLPTPTWVSAQLHKCQPNCGLALSTVFTLNRVVSMESATAKGYVRSGRTVLCCCIVRARCNLNVTSRRGPVRSHQPARSAARWFPRMGMWPKSNGKQSGRQPSSFDAPHRRMQWSILHLRNPNRSLL